MRALAYKSILPDEPEEVEEPEVSAVPEPNPVEQRLTELDAQLKALYAQNKGLGASPQVQYVPVPYGQPQQEAPAPEFNDVEDLTAYIQREAARIAEEREQALRNEVGTYLGSVLEDQFDSQLEKLKASSRFQYVQDDLEAWIRDTPAHERFTKGALKRKYNELVGEKADIIATEERKASETVTRERVVDEPVPIKSGIGAGKKKKSTPKLSGEQLRVMEDFNSQFGLNMTPEEWDAIENGALDWTKGMATVAKGVTADE